MHPAGRPLASAFAQKRFLLLATVANATRLLAVLVGPRSSRRTRTSALLAHRAAARILPARAWVGGEYAEVGLKRLSAHARGLPDGPSRKARSPRGIRWVKAHPRHRDRAALLLMFLQVRKILRLDEEERGGQDSLAQLHIGEEGPLLRRLSTRGHRHSHVHATRVGMTP
eukprot:4640655-Prymnesium_polylepis.2